MFTQDQKVIVENNAYIGSGNEPDPPCMAQPGLQPCLSSGSYTGWVKRQLNGTWTHSFPPHESGERECSLQLFYLTWNIEKFPSYNCWKAWGHGSTKAAASHGSCRAAQAPSSPSCFGLILFSQGWCQIPLDQMGQGHTEVFNTVMFSPHTHRFSASRQGHSLKSKFLCIFITVLD